MILIYVPCQDAEEAEKIATALIKGKLVACTNLLESKSMYLYEGTLEYEPESILIIKTIEEKEAMAREKINELHSYDCPAILSWNVKANDKYEKWVKDQVE